MVFGKHYYLKNKLQENKITRKQKKLIYKKLDIGVEVI